MKNLIIIFITALTLSSCDKDNDKPEIEKLPPVTQTGANTFGCLLDGQAFLPGGGTNPLDCVYQYTNGGYYFALQGNKRDSENNLFDISVGTINLQIEENNTYQLKDNQNGNAVGRFSISGVPRFTSSNTYNGEVKITKLDKKNQIVSGTFWFDVLHPFTGQVVKIREGRFDMEYSN